MARSPTASGGCLRPRSQRRSRSRPRFRSSFELETGDGKPLCAVGTVGDTGALPLVAPGDIRVSIAPDGQARSRSASA